MLSNSNKKMISKVKENRFLSFTLIVLLVSLLNVDLFAKSDTLVIIRTNYGVIKLKLYDETPIHKHNFIKLAKSGFYDSLLFHRVINGFMIQGGDPDSKGANQDQTLGNGNIGYTLPPEINSACFHKKGALAAARQGDEENPNRYSSGCQFYIVQGKRYGEMDMVTVESRMANQVKQNLIWKYLWKPENLELKERYIAYQKARNIDSLTAINRRIQPLIESDLQTHKAHKFSKEEKLIYSSLGGSPHLDGNYTVFGEVIEGLDVIDRIAEAEVTGNGRPVQDIIMKVTIEIVNN